MIPQCQARCDFYAFGSLEPCWGKVTVGAYYDGAEHLCEGHPSRGSTRGRYRPRPASLPEDTEPRLPTAMSPSEREQAGRAAHGAHVLWAQEEGSGSLLLAPSASTTLLEEARLFLQEVKAHPPGSRATEDIGRASITELLPLLVDALEASEARVAELEAEKTLACPPLQRSWAPPCWCPRGTA